MQNTAIKKIIIQRVGSPKIFVYLVIWLMFLVFFGTIAQRDSGLYLVQLDYFSSWIKWFGPIPTPSAKFTMFLMTLNLSTYFFRDYIWKIQKIGITITHAGVLLLLLGGGLTSLFSIEGSMIIDEGKRSNFFENYYIKEFIIIDKSNSQYDQYTIFDEHLLHRGALLNSETIPFDIEVLDYYVNCNPVQRVYLGNENFQGMAKNFYLQELKPEKEYEKNRPGIIYEVKGKNTVKYDGIYILFMGQTIPQEFDLFEVQLRPYRTYLPFEIELIDFKKEMHPGTEIAKSFSSKINLHEDGIKRPILIQMNEPLRHQNYTFYQSSYREGIDRDTTILSVVKNYGRLFPYISSIIMCFGLLLHIILKVPRLFKERRKRAAL